MPLMAVRAISMRLLPGRTTPEIRNSWSGKEEGGKRKVGKWEGKFSSFLFPLSSQGLSLVVAYAWDFLGTRCDGCACG